MPPGTANDLTQSFTYNPAGQIASASMSNDAYVFDQTSNFTRDYANNGLNQTTAVYADALTWDANGEAAFKARWNGGGGNLASWGSKSYTFTENNLLKTGPGNTTLGWDAMFRLRTVDDGTDETLFGYSGLDLIGEYDGSGTLLRRASR